MNSSDLCLTVYVSPSIYVLIKKEKVYQIFKKQVFIKVASICEFVKSKEYIAASNCSFTVIVQKDLLNYVPWVVL